MLASSSHLYSSAAMDSRHSYEYGYQAQPAVATAPRYNTNHGTSSAFSANANPNEDWTKISDLAERRRIQNRIAQRNYRKKLKRRLEDLEKKAATGETSPPPPEKRRVSNDRSRAARSPQENATPVALSASADSSSGRYYTSSSPELTPVEYLDNGRDLFERGYTKSPPMFTNNTYSTYATPDQSLYAPYQQQASYQGMPMDVNAAYTSQAPAYALQSAQDSRQPTLFAEEELLNQFNVNYSSLSGLEAPMQYPEYSTNSPPSYGFSSTGSPSDSSIILPTTPIDVPDSPQFKLS